ncbi:protein CMSS1 [Biomphalaria pfeifferi]|uniref:Protein CMSS1 n=1 Tax=Biomphalaria pfeifferi TaxID=112525 RepID=A0AAD8F7Z4_BIOPF|nr:protein CMSS1 [Biomphalaria pfeifferi]
MADDLDDEWWLNEKKTSVSIKTEKVTKAEVKKKFANLDTEKKLNGKGKKVKPTITSEAIHPSGPIKEIKKKKRKLSLERKDVTSETKQLSSTMQEIKNKKRKLNLEGKDLITRKLVCKDAKREQITKQKSESEGVATMDGKQNKNNKSGKEKKRQRKKITDESDETLSKPGTAEDVKIMLTKALKDRLGAEAFYDILPDTENDYYPDNCDLLEPDKYLSSVLTTWRSAVKKSIFMKTTGSPCLLIVASSAIRAVELNRQIKGFLDGKCKVAKLFAKHMKVEEQKKFLSKTNCQVGIGTPGRILMLIKQGALQLESLIAVVLDWNWRDSKMKRMADIPEVRQDLVSLLKDYVLETVRGSSCKLALL